MSDTFKFNTLTIYNHTYLRLYYFIMLNTTTDRNIALQSRVVIFCIFKTFIFFQFDFLSDSFILVVLLALLKGLMCVLFMLLVPFIVIFTYFTVLLF